MAKFTMAAPELTKIEIDGITRSAFVARAALAAGAVYGGTAVGPFVRQALAQEGAGDVKVLNFALTLEFLEAEFYKQALENVRGLSGEVRRLTEEIRANEDEHVGGLSEIIRSLGGTPVAKPGVRFGDAFRNEDAYLDLAETFEDTGVTAYNGAGVLLESKEVLAAAGTIAQIEGRHASLIRLLRDHEITSNGALDGAASVDQVRQQVMPFLA